MKIIVDGDSCPVKDIILKISSEYNIGVTFFVSINHIVDLRGLGEVIYVDNISQEVDIKIANFCESGDIVVTNDYGLASLVISKGCKAISPRGIIFSKENIDLYLFNRHVSLQIRKDGHKTKGPKKRSREDDNKFKEGLIKLVENNK